MPNDKVPEAVLDELSPARTVVFDIHRLEAIELAFDKSATDLFGQLAGVVPQSITPGAPLTPAQGQEMARKARWSLMAPFIVACLDVPKTELAATVPMQHMWSVFFKLFGAMGGALALLNGGGEETADPPPRAPAPGAESGGASGGSEPGPGSS